MHCYLQCITEGCMATWRHMGKVTYIYQRQHAMVKYSTGTKTINNYFFVRSIPWLWTGPQDPTCPEVVCGLVDWGLL